jgi:hypothetical protein
MLKRRLHAIVFPVLVGSRAELLVHPELGRLFLGA